MRRLVPALLILIGLALAGLVAVRPIAQEAQTTVLGDLISRALSTPATRVQIGAVDGALSSDATIRDITIADRDGVWLRVDTARLVWRRLALLQGRLEVDRLEIGRLEVLRRPLPADGPPPASNEPILPELPVKVVVGRFSLAELVLGEPLFGTAARVTATGNASLGAPAEGLALQLDARRLDQPGTLTARLSLVPQTQALTVALNLDEPAGGIAARAANLPGLPPVTFRIDGDGTLDAFAARLAFDAGPGIGATGRADLTRAGAARLLGLALEARIEGLLPPIAAPVFAGATRLDGRLSFGDDGALGIQALSIRSRTAELTARGGMSAAKDLDLALNARALPTDGARTVAGGAEIGRLALDATINGPVTGPRVAANLDLADARLPAGRVGQASARFTATPDGLLSQPGTRLALVADGEASGIALTDPALARAVGDRATVTLRGTRSQDGVVAVDRFALTSPSLEASFAGRAGPPLLDGRLTLALPDLSRFADMAGTRLAGRLDGTVGLGGVPAENRIDAALDLTATRFATGIAPVDGAVGGRLALKGGVSLLPAGGYGFRDLRLTGAHGDVRLDGTATAENAAITLAATLPDLKRLDGRLTGRGTLDGRLTGTVTRPDGTLRLALTEATMLGRAVPQLVVNAEGRDLTGALDGRVTLDGTVGGRRAAGGFALRRLQPAGWQIDGLDLGIGSVSARGAVSLDGASRAEGQIAIVARDLDDLSPLLLTRLAGDLEAQLVLSRPDGRQDVTLTGRGQQLRAGEARIERFTADLTARGVPSRPVIDGTLAIDSATIGGEAISRIRFDAKAAGSGSDLTLAAAARGFDLAAAARLLADVPDPAQLARLDLARFEARRGASRIALVQPGGIALLADGGVRVDRIGLGIGGGRADINGTIGEALDLTLGLRAIPLAAAEIVQPGIGLSGTLDGEARIGGSRAAPEGDWRLRISGFAAPQTRSAGLPPIAATASGRLAGGRSSLDATLDAGRAANLRLRGSVPLAADGALDLAIDGRAELALANATLGAGGRRVTGAARIDAAIRGTLAAPRIDGTADLSGGTFSDAEQGISLTGIEGRIAARGERVTIERLTARTRNGGTLVAGGEVSLDAAGGFPGQITLRTDRAELVASRLATAVASLDLTVEGPLARRPTIGGRVDIVSLDVRVPERLPATIRPIEKARHIAPPPQVRAKLALDARARAARAAGPAFDAALNLVIAAPNRIFVRGRGIEAELGGDLRLTGTLAALVPVGGFSMRRGRIQIAGQRLDFSRGTLTFGGTLTPELDFLAETAASGITAQVGVTGPANEPSFAFTSVPELPPDEVLSRLLFARASGGLSPTQALQLAQVAAQFAGGGGDDAFERLRRSLGVDSLDIQLGAGGTPEVGLSRAISDRVSVGVKAGASPDKSGLSVDIDVTRRIRVQGEATGDGATSVGIGAEWEY